MKFLSHGNTNPRYVRPGTVLPPADLFRDYPEAVEALETMAKHNAAIKRHQQGADEARAAIPAADKAYGLAIRKALRTGDDSTAIVRDRPRLETEAEQHEVLEQEARAAAAAYGHEIGGILARYAPEVMQKAETDMVAALDKVDELEAAKRKPQAEADKAWQTRKLLASYVEDGGQLPPWSPYAAGGTRENLERLQKDEATLVARREREAEVARRQHLILGTTPESE